LLAHPSRNEILRDLCLSEKPLAAFASKVVAVLQDKYYTHGGAAEGCGKKLL